MCKTIKQKVTLQAGPAVVYQLLADAKKHSQVTGRKASISRAIGGRFSLLSGDVTGINVDLVPGKRIVQAWRSRQFPIGIYSMASFTLEPTKSGGTLLTLTHRGVPKDLIPQTEDVWRQMYWQKLRKYLSIR